MDSVSSPNVNPSPRDQSVIDLFNTLASPNPTDKTDNVFHREVLQTLLYGQIDGLRTTPFDYQCRSAAMMFQREQGIKYLENEVTTSSAENAASAAGGGGGVYDSRIGGILAEEMGSGKTLICLMLILASKFLKVEMPGHVERREVIEDESVPSLLTLCTRTIMTQGVPWLDRNEDYHERLGKLIREQRELHKLDSYEVTRATSSRLARRDTVDVQLSNATLIVVPGNLTVQWEREILKHIYPYEESGIEFRYVVVSERGAIPPARELAELDLLLISRARFDKEIRDGEDSLGRRKHSGVQRLCSCEYQNSKSNARACTCPSDGGFYSSPLLSVHWKRIIVDEGHSMASAMTNSVLVADMLHVNAKWAVTGTPSSGLYTKNENMDDDGTRIQVSEKRDLRNIGQIVTKFLKLPPYDSRKTQWPNKVEDALASGVLRSVLERVMIRHRISDIELEAALPPLYEKVVKIKPGFYERLSLNLFLAQMASNEVTSERTDQDWFFHPSQRKSLNEFVNNIRESAFYWTALNIKSVEQMRQTATKYLDEDKVKLPADRELLKKVIATADIALSNDLWKTYSVFHEMGFCIKHLPQPVQSGWSMDPSVSFGDDALIGSTQLMAMQNFVSKNAYSGRDMTAILAAEGEQKMPEFRTSTREMDAVIAMKEAGEISEQKYEMIVKKYRLKSSQFGYNKSNKSETPKKKKASQTAMARSKSSNEAVKPNGILKVSGKESEDKYLTHDSPLHKVTVAGVTSAKLAYLISKVLEYKDQEKILIFYETDQVAWYIAEALSLVGVPHLLYARTGVNIHRKAEYLVTFNNTDTFRVFLLDVSQAAQGIHLGCASRVFFVNPIWQPPSVLAQAIKRAHRIGQTKPVYVETLILEGTIEETIFQRKNQMKENDFRGKKLMVDDEGLRNLLTKEPFMDMTEGLGNDQMYSALERPQRLFGEGKVGALPEHPDLDIVKLESTAASSSGYQSPKPSVLAEPAGQEVPKQQQEQQQPPKKRKRVLFAVDDDDDMAGNDRAQTPASSSRPSVVRFQVDEPMPQSDMVMNEDTDPTVETITQKISLFGRTDGLFGEVSSISQQDSTQQACREYTDEEPPPILKKLRFVDAEV